MPSNHDKFLETISSLDGRRPSLLLHVCCAPCLAGVLDRVAPHFDVTLYYCNPNIMPQDEYDKRYLEIEKLLALLGYTTLPLIKEEYAVGDFLAFATPLKDEKEGGPRCRQCISLRLAQSANFARKNAFDYFCTTLSVSPHKDAKFINEEGERLQEACAVRWLYSDFKKDDGFLQSTRLSKELGLYRQSYCGCKL